MDIENRFTVDCAMSSSSVLNSRMWQMPERRRLGTGENITRSGLTAHWDMRRRTSSVLPVINGEQLIVLMYVDKLVFSLLLRTPISSGPRNGEQPIRAANKFFVTPQPNSVNLAVLRPRC